MGNMNEFILYVLRDNKQLSVIDIFDEIDKIPCEKPWSNEAITPKNSCSSCCYRMSFIANFTLICCIRIFRHNYYPLNI